LKRTSIQEIAFDHILDDLTDNAKLFRSIQKVPAGRGLPSRYVLHGDIDPGIVAVLLHILRDRSVKLDFSNEAMVLCFRSGFVHTEQTEDGQLVFILPSPLHAG
jgi:hypothetical protein